MNPSELPPIVDVRMILQESGRIKILYRDRAKDTIRRIIDCIDEEYLCDVSYRDPRVVYIDAPMEIGTPLLRSKFAEYIKNHLEEEGKLSVSFISEILILRPMSPEDIEPYLRGGESNTSAWWTEQ